MRSLLREVRDIEKYLRRQMLPEEQEAFQVRLLTEPELAEKLEQQQQAYRLVRAHGRRKLREELAALHDRLMARPSFRERILALFR